ncbi:MAG: KH domain-containing protein, partial [Candidatus Saccharimonadales bacterium]
MSEIDQQFIEYVVKSLVGKPDAVHIERTIDEKGVLLQLTVDPDDLGRVIGKRGATAQSLRTLLRALGTKNDARYNLKIVDNGEGGPSQGGQSGSDDRPRKSQKDDQDDQDGQAGPEQSEDSAETAEDE